jgi:hypothetical protein
MAATKLFLVNVQDTVIQMNAYLVRAHDSEQAKDLVTSGMFIEEMKPEIMDTLDSQITAVEELNIDAEGQNHK